MAKIGTTTGPTGGGSTAIAGTFLRTDGAYVQAPGALPLLGLVAATPAAGFVLEDGTPAILSWTAPDDGNLHPVAVFCNVVVTSAETGGAGTVSYTTGGVAGSTASITGGSAAGAHAQGSAQIVVDPGSTVSLAQTSALTAGAANVYAQIWAA